MRSWVSFSPPILLAGCLFLGVSGCEGDRGISGTKGQRGRPGDNGANLEFERPEDRHFSIGIQNQSTHTVTGNVSLYLSFDSTRTPSRDTVIATRLGRSPNIDGFAEGETEWGARSSRVRLSPFLIKENGRDPEIYEATCRVGWDELYIYTLVQWRERRVHERISNRDSSIYEAFASERPHELYHDASRKIVVGSDSSQSPPVPKYYQWNRITIRSIDVVLCLPPPLDTLCVIDTTADTTMVWWEMEDSEDRLAILWSGEQTDRSEEIAFLKFFGIGQDQGTLPSEFFCDIWVWGSATSNPAFIADDWRLDDQGLSPDVGNGPYIDNFVLPDSTPRFQSILDPNAWTIANRLTSSYPFWIYSAVAFSPKGWDSTGAVYLPGIVTTSPTEGRADVYARGVFDNGSNTWTVEIKRPRRTYSNDDIVF